MAVVVLAVVNFLFILKVKPWGWWDKCLKPSRDHSLCLQELILIPGTCSHEWANMSLGQRLRTVSMQFFSLSVSLFSISCLFFLAFSFPHSWCHESKSYISTAKLMVESFLRKFFLPIVLLWKEWVRERKRQRERRCYNISSKCLQLQIRPVPQISRSIIPAMVLFLSNPFSHP